MPLLPPDRKVAARLIAGTLLGSCALLVTLASTLLPTSQGAHAQSPAPGKTPNDLRTRGAGEDWPTFLGPHQDARSAETGLLSTWPEEGPAVVWSREVGEGYSMPSVASGRLFHFDRLRDRARLTAVKSETGEELWQVEYRSVYEDAFGYSGGPRASPVVDGDRVYTFGVEGRLRCHRVADGELLWEHDTGNEYSVVTNFFGVASTPLVWKNLLIVPIGGSPEGKHDIHQGSVPSNGSGLVAFDKLTGEERYRAIDDLASYSTPIIRSLGGQERGLWLGRSGLWLFDPRTGAVQANFPFRARRVYSVNASTPIVHDDEIFLSEAYELGGVLLRLGADEELDVVWRDPPGRSQSLATHWNTAVLHEGHLYGSSGEKSGPAELRCVEWSTGRIKWSVPRLRRSTILYADGRLIVLTEYGELLLLDATAEEFRPLARVILQEKTASGPRSLIRHPAWNPPILSHGYLYVLGANRLVAVDLLAK